MKRPKSTKTSLPRVLRAEFDRRVRELMANREPSDLPLIERYVKLSLQLNTLDAEANARAVKEMSSALLSLERELELSPKARRAAGKADEQAWSVEVARALESARRASQVGQETAAADGERFQRPIQ